MSADRPEVREASAAVAEAGAAAPAEALPLVSVVVPCKNGARFLRETLDSILTQDYANIECIVVDAASTDGTLDILREYEGRLRWLSRPDRGAFDAINEGWALSQGEILAWLNADDLWEPGAVKAAVAYLTEYPDVDVVYGHCGGIDEAGTATGFYPARPWSLQEALLNCDHIIHQATSFIRRPVLERVGWLYPAWCHDHDLWLRIALAGGVFAALDMKLASARIWRGNLGTIPDVVIPGKVGLTKRFFAQPGLPPDLAAMRKRAVSNAYLRCWDYLDPRRPSHWLTAASLGFRAIASAPLNTGYVLQRGLRTSSERLLPLRVAAALLGTRRKLAAVCATVIIAVGVTAAIDESWRTARDELFAVLTPLLLLAIWLNRTGER